MSKPKILLQLDGDAQASVFDAVVAVDAGVDHLLRHQNVAPEQVRDLVHGAMFTRGGDDLRYTAIFVGGSDVATGERLLEEVRGSFFGPVRVSVMIDSNGANTTAAAAVLAAGKHLTLAETTAVVLGATGPVGARVVRLLAREGAQVRAGSRGLGRARAVCEAVAANVSDARIEPCATASAEDLAAALEGAELLVAAGAAGIEMLSADARGKHRTLKVAIDLNAVPPTGIGGIEITDRAAERDGQICYGAIGVGGMKMKIHKAALRRLFEANDLVLDAEEIYALGRELS